MDYKKGALQAAIRAIGASVERGGAECMVPMTSDVAEALELAAGKIGRQTFANDGTVSKLAFSGLDDGKPWRVTAVKGMVVR